MEACINVREMWRPCGRCNPTEDGLICLVQSDNGMIFLSRYDYKSDVFRFLRGEEISNPQRWIPVPMSYSPTPSADLPIEVNFRYLMADYKKVKEERDDALLQINYYKSDILERDTRIAELEKKVERLTEAAGDRTLLPKYRKLEKDYKTFTAHLIKTIETFNDNHQTIEEL